MVAVTPQTGPTGDLVAQMDLDAVQESGLIRHKTTYSKKDMDTQTFISKYRQAFGETAELPLLFYYDNEPVADTDKINGCLFKGMDTARKGEGLSLSAETIGCGGGKLYTAFAPMPEHVPGFVSQKERYKASPEDVITCIERLDIRPATKKYLNFIRIDRAKSFEPMEGILFFATPDMLSGLATWAFFDNNADDAVSCIFGSGCSSVVAQAVRENRIGGRRTFIGLLDPSVRPYVESNVLSFVIPASRFKEMCRTMDRCCLFHTNAWNKVKERITHNS